jgi:charged multivesicular body protein 1
MDKFEEQFQELDVRTGVLEGAMSSATASSMPEDQVDRLLQEVHGATCCIPCPTALKLPPLAPCLRSRLQVADENDLEIAVSLADAGTHAVAEPTPTRAQDDELSRRLAALRS